MTTIEWTDSTWNPIVGCSKISEGCRNCYAINQAHRNAAMAAKMPNPGRLAYYDGLTEKRGDRIEWTGQVRFVPKALEVPIKTRKPTRWFVNSMSDLFHESVTDEQLDRIFAVMAMTPQHTYQVLTKRPERMLEYLTKPCGYTDALMSCGIAYGRESLIRQATLPWWSPSDDRGISFPLPNVWLGVTAENQKAADDRIPYLVQTPAAIRFLSCEPLLEALDLSTWVHPRQSMTVGFSLVESVKVGDRISCVSGIDWVITGAESGHGARPMNEDWVRGLRDQCVPAGVHFFYKQKLVGGHKVGLPELDGKVWAEFPSDRR